MTLTAMLKGLLALKSWPLTIPVLSGIVLGRSPSIVARIRPFGHWGFVPGGTIVDCDSPARKPVLAATEAGIVKNGSNRDRVCETRNGASQDRRGRRYARQNLYIHKPLFSKSVVCHSQCRRPTPARARCRHGACAMIAFRGCRPREHRLDAGGSDSLGSRALHRPDARAQTTRRALQPRFVEDGKPIAKTRPAGYRIFHVYFPRQDAAIAFGKLGITIYKALHVAGRL